MAWLIKNGYPFNNYKLIFGKPPVRVVRMQQEINYNYWDDEDSIGIEISLSLAMILNGGKAPYVNDDPIPVAILSEPQAAELNITIPSGEEEKNMYLLGALNAFKEIWNEKDNI